MTGKIRGKKRKIRGYPSNSDKQNVPDAGKEYLEFLFQSVSRQLKDQYRVSVPDLIRRSEDDILLPDFIFNKELGVLEAACKFLKENLDLSNQKIAGLVGRSGKSVWQSVNSAKAKMPEPFSPREPRHFIPVSVLRDDSLAVLESVVVYCRESLELSNHETARILHRDDRTVWTVYNRARRKNAKK